MTPDQQRIAIATACGWTDIRRQRLYAGDQDLWGTKLKGGEKHRNRLPDYLGDLNACHEMEKVLTVAQTAEYITTLCLEVQPEPMLYHATAAQRCEAFLRTLGLWEEEANTTKSVSPTSAATEQSSATGSEPLPNGTTYTRSYQVFLPTPTPIPTPTNQ